MTKHDTAPDRIYFNAPIKVRDLVRLATRDRVDLHWERGAKPAPDAWVQVCDDDLGIYIPETGQYLGQCVRWGA